MSATTPVRTVRRNQGDENLIVSFRVAAIESTLKSKEKGVPVFDDVDLIKIVYPGDQKIVIDTLVDEEYAARFADEYEAFKAKRKIAESGTPLEHWAILSPSQIENLKSINVRTVQALAALPDANVQFLGGIELREKARVYLKTAEDASIVEKQAAEIAELRAQLDGKDKKSKKAAAEEAVAE